MIIKKLVELSSNDFNSLGDFGYISNQKYEAVKLETLQSCMIQLNLIELAEPYVKKEMNDDEDIKRYNEIVKMEHSLGLYVDNNLVAFAITEPQAWNNTLLIWHFQVHQDFKRKGYGKLLLEKVFRLAADNQFRAVTLETQNTNAPAIHFYKNCGFTIEGIDLSLYNDQGDAANEVAIYMRKKI
ncbi:GNAT family N-acetyltransferase [Paenibacillus sp. GSMTC-2017]|uniref:GNAT family N-acetyltransferase n=1 Tax=Paenibacillus sp. GSMTC-2017 TaxID=2794350 RepID=UPI0018D69F27|nr:GNAT family N-acetyltransferase [Paenibacillus sp. GSMTC-2017]